MNARYNRGKIRAREAAQAWQADFSAHSYSYSKMADFQEMFSRLARRFGLVREFRENGII